MFTRVKVLSLLMLGFLIAGGGIVRAEEGRVPVILNRASLNTNKSPNTLYLNQFSKTTNFLFDEKPGSALSRGEAGAGYSLVSSTVCREMWPYQKSSGQLRLMIHHEGRLAASADHGRTFFNIASGFQWNLNWLHAVTFDDLFLVSDGMTKAGIYDGYEWTEYDFIPKCKYWTVYNNMVIGANSSDIPAGLYWSMPRGDITEEETWPKKNLEIIGGKSGDKITAVIVYRGKLVIFFEYSMWEASGTNPATWRIRQLSPNYGARSQESVTIDKELLKFVSYNGLKGYNGNSIGPIDTSIKSDILDSNNLKGEYSYVTLTHTSDFKSLISTGITVENSELHNTEYETQWKGTDLDGTLSNVAYNSGMIQLSTTTQTTLTTYTRNSPYGEWQFTGYNYRDLIDDNAGNYTDTCAIKQDTAYIKSNHPAMYLTFNTGAIKLKQLNLKLSANMYAYITADVKGQKRSSKYNARRIIRHNTLAANSVITYVYAKVDLLQEDGIYDVTSIPEILVASAGTPAASSSGEINIHKYSSWFGSSYRSTGRWTAAYAGAVVNALTFNNIKARYDTVGLRVTFRATATRQDNIGSFYEFSSLKYSATDWGFNIDRVFDATIKYSATDNVYNASGSAALASKEISDYTVNIGTVVINYGTEAYNYEILGTSATVYLDTSNNGSDWNGYEKIIIDTNTWTGYTAGLSGKYIRPKIMFATNDTDQTARFTDIFVNSSNQNGYFKSESIVAHKLTGGWYYFLSDDNEAGDIEYSVYFSTYQLGTEPPDSGFSNIESGSLLSGTTNQNFLWYKVESTNTIGGQVSKVRSLTFIYIPDETPVEATMMSFNDRLHVALSTPTDTNNSTIYVEDKNSNWTTYELGCGNVISFCKFGKDMLMTNGASIYKMYDGSDDAGVAITSTLEKVFAFDYSYDSRLKYIYTIGQTYISGALNVQYSIENTTNTYSAANIDSGSPGRYRHMQQSGRLLSKGADWTAKWTSTSTVQIDAIELWPDIIIEHKKQ